MDTLHEISAQHRELAALVENKEMTAEDVRDTFEALEGEMSAKAASLIAVVDNMKSFTASIDDEIKRLQARKKALVNRQDSLRNYLKVNMQQSGISKISCPLFSITLAKGRDTVFIDDEALIPDDYVSVEVVTKPSKAEIMKALKAGEEVPGARLAKSDESLRIK